jgi:hypothetical protein
LRWADPPSKESKTKKEVKAQKWAAEPLIIAIIIIIIIIIIKTPWSESASELYRPSDRLLSAK